VGRTAVEEFSPMKRGLKGSCGTVFGVFQVVEEFSPMKRGLKVNPDSHYQT